MIEKHTIEFEELIDFTLFGISSSLSESYQFVYHLNRYFQTNFIRMREDLDVLLNNEKMIYYPLYEWIDDDHQLTYHLIKNYSFLRESEKTEHSLFHLFEATPMLIPQYKNHNYILKITSYEDDPDSIPMPIWQADWIQNVIKIDLTKVKTKDRLFF